MPLPTRWTFASALPASAHCPDASLRPPGFARFQSPLVGRDTPDLLKRGPDIGTRGGIGRTGKTFDDLDTRYIPIRRQDAAREHQRDVTNLGFVASRPQESRTGCPSFP